MKNIIVGTAGHIDHGKTALVKALTGIDADRLEEEKRRGITIDLGFAHLELTPELRLGFVDVPGHERFVKNMLAGAGGIDLVLFAIAADESIKPQTREHFDICRLLGIPRGIVALTKADLVDRDILDLVRLETEEFVTGSFLEGAAVVAVSARTGEGLDTLRNELRRAAAEVSGKSAARHFRLPVDRAFSMKGFGTVVTGTLLSGSVGREREVEAHPGGRRYRVRGVQVHGEAAERAVAGQRTALNLPDADPSDLFRGMVLSEPGVLRSVDRIDVKLDLLPSAKPLKHRAPVHFHGGSAEIEAEMRLPRGMSALKPGDSTFARIVLREPTLILPGDRFIIRMFSPVVTIGGGAMVDAAVGRSPEPDRLKLLHQAAPDERVAMLVRESGHGMGVGDLIARTGLLEEELTGIARSDRFVLLDRWLADAAWMRAARERLAAQVRDFHRKNPLLPGVTRTELRDRVLPGSPPFLLDALLSGLKELAAEGEVIRHATHKLVLKQDEENARAAIEAAFERSGLQVPGVSEVLAKSGVEAARARSLLQILIREKRLVRVTEDLVFHQAAILSLRELLSAHRGGRFNVATFKDWTGISRKYAIPLLEFLDREKVTRREGDERIVL